MSRMTSAQVIALGEYLNPNFDPASLTVSQLLGVLGFHNINFPTPYTKPKLIQVFNEEVKSRASKFKRERLKKENSIASDDGITDGVTGEPLGGRKVVPPIRRSSRRISRITSEEEEPDFAPIRPDPPKRRRSSAQPNLGGPSRRVVPSQVPLTEESEPEEETLPVRKVGRKKKTSEAAGVQARRVSQPDSGWEDNNIFQSGAESSSPVRPSPVRAKASRKSIVPRKSRKSTSAPPQFLSSSPPQPYLAEDEEELRPPQSKFEPQLPPNISRDTVLTTPSTKPTKFVPVEYWEPSADDIVDDGLNQVSDGLGVTEEVMEVGSDSVEEDEESQNVAISRRLAQDSKALGRPRSLPSPKSKLLPTFLRILFMLFTIAASGVVLNYKIESAPIGYCDTDSNTNSALEEFKSRLSATEACNRENRTLLYLPSISRDDSTEGDETPCPLLPLVPLPHPTTCSPCPEHATCTQHSVTCNTGYLMRSHSLLFFLPPVASPSSIILSPSTPPLELVWKIISLATDGLPGLGSVGLPPRCLEDPKRKRNIGVLGKAIEKVLGQERGRIVCDGDHETVPESAGGEAKKWGLELEVMREVMAKKTAPHLLPTFNDTFNEAIQQLIQWGGVIISEDSDGRRYLAHRTPDLTWNCALTVKSREVWAAWRSTVFGVVMVIISGLIGRARRAQRLVEETRVSELVQIALDTLRNQELAHHTDPITAPQSFLSSLQLRDLILQDEHSVSTRKRLWDKVERVVEGNANVRANLEEVHGGDEMRVWRWVGSPGGAGVRKRE